MSAAALGAAGFEIGHADARGQTGRTFRAGRAVKHVLAAPEALFRQRVVQLLRMLALKRSEQLPLHPPRQVGAGLRRRHVELGREGKGVAHRVRIGRSDGNPSKPVAIRQAPSDAAR